MSFQTYAIFDAIARNSFSMEILNKDLNESNNESFCKTHLQLFFKVPRSVPRSTLLFFSTNDTQIALYSSLP